MGFARYFSLIMAIFIIFGMRENDVAEYESHKTNENQSNVSNKLKKKFIWGFPLRIFVKEPDILLQELLVAIVKSIPSLSDYAALSWMFVGLGAIPSTILWSMLADVLGHGKATYLAFILQIISVVLPIFSESMLSLILSSLLFGSRF